MCYKHSPIRSLDRWPYLRQCLEHAAGQIGCGRALTKIVVVCVAEVLQVGEVVVRRFATDTKVGVHVAQFLDEGGSHRTVVESGAPQATENYWDPVSQPQKTTWHSYPSILTSQSDIPGGCPSVPGCISP